MLRPVSQGASGAPPLGELSAHPTEEATAASRSASPLHRFAVTLPLAGEDQDVPGNYNAAGINTPHAGAPQRDGCSGWRSVVTGGLSVYRCSTDHAGILQAPHVEAVGEVLLAALARAQREPATLP